MGIIRRELREEEPGEVFRPVLISESEIASMLAESDNLNSFRQHLKNRYQAEIESRNFNVGEMVLADAETVPDFVRDSMIEKYGTRK